MTALVHLLNLLDQKRHSSHSCILNSLVADTLSYSGWAVVVVVVVVVVVIVVGSVIINTNRKIVMSTKMCFPNFS